MHPWLLHHPPITTYGACILAGLILAWLLARSLACRASLDPTRIDLLVPLLVAAGLLGAYAFGALADSLAAISVHATVLLGSLLLATAAGIVYALFSRIPLGLLGDISAAPVALGIATGRLGCFFAGCCYGTICTHSFSPIHITFPQYSFAWYSHLHQNLLLPDAPASLPVYPVQLYESALCLLLALLLAYRFHRRTISGERFLYLGISYPLIRFPLEFLRADNPPFAIGLTFSQAISLFVFLLSLATLIFRRLYADILRLRLPQPAT